jgi:hypothetical protein
MNSLYINENSESKYNIADLLCDMAIFFSKFSIVNPQENLYCQLFSSIRDI